MPLNGAADDAPCRASLQDDARDARAYDQSRPGGMGIREPGLDHRLLGADTAAEPAIAAFSSLCAAANVARHRVHVPAELDAPFLQLLLAGGGFVVLAVHPEPFGDRIEAVGVLLRLEGGDPM